LNDAEYLETQEQLQMVALIVLNMDLDGFFQRIGTTEAVAPILDPTAYMRGAESLTKVRRHAEALRDFQRVVAQDKQDTLGAANASR